ncbi:MAG: hypothetical protein HC802_12830 [Caldilineaceae bacterium]|nr:hypothetical protein [Caldilineaceae bacterium]
MIREGRKIDPGILLILAFFIVLLPILFKPWVHGADTIGYYGWLRSAVIDGDLQTADEFAHYGMAWLNTFAETGLRDSPGAVGSALLWSPWFLLVHAATLAGQALGLPLIADGYSQQYVWAASLASSLYALIGLWLTYLVAQDLVARKLALLAVIVAWLASPLLFTCTAIR